MHADQFNSVLMQIVHLCRYWILREFYAPQLASCEPPLPAEVVTRQILERVDITGWERGRTKIMLKFNHTAELKRHTNNIMKRIITIQRCERSCWEGEGPGLNVMAACVYDNIRMYS